MTWERIKAWFGKGDESTLPQTRRSLAEILASQQPKFTQERVAAVAPSRRADFDRALEWAASGEHLQAIEVYSRLIGEDRYGFFRAFVFFARGESYAALGRYEDSIADYEFPLRHIDVPGEVEFSGRWKLFFLFQQSGQLERATAILRELVECCTRVVQEYRVKDKRLYFYQRALARAGGKEYSKASADCQSALYASGSVGKAVINELQAAILVEARN